MIALPLVAAFTANAATAAVFDGRLPLPVQQLVISVVTVLVAVVAVVTSHRLLRVPRRIADYGLAIDATWVRRAVAGFGIGGVAVVVPVTLALAAGHARVVETLSPDDLGFLAGVVPLIVGMVLVAFWEELLLRGVFVGETAAALRRRWTGAKPVVAAVVISSTVFGLGHLGQPDHPAFLLTWILAGLVFGALYVVSGDLALPIGAHAAFNIGHNALLVRTDLAGTDALSAVARVEFAPAGLLQPGGLLEVTGFLLIGALSLVWLQTRRTS
jgi:uncharacterized protein